MADRYSELNSLVFAKSDKCSHRIRIFIQNGAVYFAISNYQFDIKKNKFVLDKSLCYQLSKWKMFAATINEMSDFLAIFNVLNCPPQIKKSVRSVTYNRIDGTKQRKRTHSIETKMETKKRTLTYGNSSSKANKSIAPMDPNAEIGQRAKKEDDPQSNPIMSNHAHSMSGPNSNQNSECADQEPQIELKSKESYSLNLGGVANKSRGNTIQSTKKVQRIKKSQELLKKKRGRPFGSKTNILKLKVKIPKEKKKLGRPFGSKTKNNKVMMPGEQIKKLGRPIGSLTKVRKSVKLQNREDSSHSLIDIMSE